MQRSADSMVLIFDQNGHIKDKYGPDLFPEMDPGNSIFECFPLLKENLPIDDKGTVTFNSSCELQCFPLMVQNHPGYIAVINRSNQYELDAGQAEELNLYRLLFNLPYEGSLLIDQNGIIRLANSAFCKYLDYKPEELIGHRIDEFKIDPNLMTIISSRRPDILAFYPNPKLLASRQPVMENGKVIGAYGRYVALDVKCIQKNILDLDEYIDIISRLDTRDIMLNVTQFLAELNSYRDEFNRLNASCAGVDRIKGSSSVMAALRETILWISGSPSSVLITGESGTGKELFAQAIHFHGDRSQGRFVKVNCAAIPESLLESELFGYVDGSFTGARKGGKMGKFELANHGTIFLDEIGDMPLIMQAKLLRVLQEKEIERIGDDHTIPVDVRIISATNKDLKWMINQGTFRPDLYYRLNVVNLHIPALRERKEDIPPLVYHFLEELNRKLGLNIRGIEAEAMDLLLHYDWPGNVRELLNVLETSMNFCRQPSLSVEALPFFLRQNRSDSHSVGCNLKTSLLDAEKERIKSALRSSSGNRQQAAALLGVSRTTLYRLMKKHHIIYSSS